MCFKEVVNALIERIAVSERIRGRGVSHSFSLYRMSTRLSHKLSIVAFVLLLTFCAASKGMSQWVPTNGPYGGNVTALAVNGSDLFAGTASGGVFLSTNMGTSWRAVNTGMTNTTVHALAVSGSNVFAGTDGGAFLTSDRGSHWTAIDAGITDLRIESLTVSGTNVFATTGSTGSFVTTNQGAAWSNTIAGLPTAWAGAFAGSGARLYAAVGNDSVAVSSIYYSTDNGNSWSAITSTNRVIVGSSFIIEGLAVSGTNLYAYTYGTGVLRSTDNGVSWIGPLNGVPPSGNFHSFAVSGTNVFVGTDEGVYLSTDSGVSWQGLHVGGQSYIGVRAIAVNSMNLFVGTDQGAFLSTDSGATWAEIDTGLTNSNINSLAASGKNLISGTQLASFGAHDGVLSTDNGASWTHWNNTIPNYGISALFVRDKNLLAATDSGIFRSRDDGMTWTSISDSINFAMRNIIALAQSDSFLFAASQSTVVLRSTDDGVSWNIAFRPESYGIQSLAASGPNICIATPMIDVSNDNGLTWKDIGDPAGANVVIASGTDFFAGYFNGVYRSTNGGTTWVVVNDGLTDTSVTALFASGTNLFAGTRSGGVFLSTNNGASWKSVGDGLTTATIKVFTDNGMNLFAGTAGAGVWSRPLSEMISTSAVASTQPGLSSVTAFPNPFNQSTTIDFATSQQGFVQLDVYDMFGRTVQTLVKSAMEPGHHSAHFDIGSLPSGIYTLRLTEASGQRQIKLSASK